MSAIEKKNSGKSWINVLVLVMALMLIFPATALAQGGGGNGGAGQGPGQFMNPRHLMGAADELGLSEDQREEIREILAANRPAIGEFRRQMRNEGQKLREALADEASGDQEVMAQLDTVLAVEAQFKRQRMELVLAVRNVLDEEQRAQARELLQQRRGDRMERRQERRQQRQQQRRGQ